jgi:hypothetical protein
MTLITEEAIELDELTELLLGGLGSELELAIRSSGQSAGLEDRVSGKRGGDTVESRSATRLSPETAV